ncbi:ABC transporter ATP-binding protein [Diplocloster agilis]|uniref:ABC transporter ATP-binding protein n=1 Tax=Diplocloster agilis TaxID=2850323 RepID=A0A949K4U4_9FIRM|nr:MULTISPECIES: ABC transporter ATP-binding protein [Lachnospiraceae]MBU9738985.1 ABC transporter ATP-binding protein [Diplocloster agilis]MCU6735906.1 ABC transporter ATP-binding protein [Suonthocola fibrivorans]SCJ83968.1 Lipoprotein-releasing system ATP-binding protein LolD [uncultured Clostridium sp.]
MEILKCKELTKTYGTGENAVHALDHVNFRADSGEFIAIVGASGSGKSTLLHLIGGVDSPTSGQVIIDGTDIVGMPERKLSVFRRRKVGLIYQFYNLIPTMNVLENIMLPMRLDGRLPEKEELAELTDTLGLTDRLRAYPGELSGGQQQRVAIARSLIYRPAILLADEPTGNLDRKNSEETMALFRLCNQKYNQTILLITHDENAALQAGRIITIEDGKLMKDEVTDR